MRNRPDGRYRVGIRPHHIGSQADDRSTAVDGKVLITEISGSESVIHFAHDGLTWVSQSHGVRRLEVGATAQFYVDSGQCMYFDGGGRRIAP
jgi:glycerol transport system ATP-binding protein